MLIIFCYSNNRKGSSTIPREESSSLEKYDVCYFACRVTMAVGINEALVRVRSQVNVSVALFWKSTECFKASIE